MANAQALLDGINEAARGSTYQTWARAYPNEDKVIRQYYADLIAGKNPTLPSITSRLGKGFAIIGSGFATATPTPPPPPTPPPVNDSFFVTPDDLRTLKADSVWDGTKNPTQRDFQAFIDSFDGVNKRMAGIKWGSKLNLDLSANVHISFSHKGKPGAPIWFFPVEIPSGPVTQAGFDLGGRFVYYNNSGWIKWSWGKFDGSHYSTDAGGNTSAITVGGNDVEYERFVMRQSDPTYGTIGFSPIDGVQWGPGVNFKCRIGKIYDIGRWPVGNTTDSGFYMHGAYNQTLNPLFENLWVWNVSRAGLLMRGSQGGTFRYCAIDRCGTCVIFGDNNSSNNDVHHVIATNAYQQGAIDSYCVYAWQTGSGNKFHDSTTFGGQKGNINAPGVSVALATILQKDPKYKRGLLSSERGATAGKYDPSLIDLRPTDPEVAAALHGAHLMVPFS